MKRGGPLPRKRATPRRQMPERVPGARTRPKAGSPPSAAEKRLHDHLRAGPCQCGCGRRAECVHHLLSDAPGKVGRRDHGFVVGLAHECHNLGTKSVHLLGSEAAFMTEHGVDLVAIAVENRALL